MAYGPAINISWRRLRKAVYAPVLAFSMSIMLGRLLLYARILELDAFAQLSAVLVISGIVGMLSSFGFFLDLQRKLPGFLARGQKRSAAMRIWQSLLGTFATGVIGLAMAGAGFQSGSISPLVIVLGMFHGVSQQAFLIQTTESRSDRDPLRFSLQSLARAVGILLLATPVAWEFRTATAIIVAECFITSGLALLISWRISKRWAIPHSVAALLALRSFRRTNWGTVAALLFLSLAVATSINADRWLSSFTLTPSEFARYAFASIIITGAAAAQQLLNAAVFPMIAMRFSVHGMRSAYRLSVFASFGMLVLFLIVLVPAAYIFTVVINSLYPKYMAAVPLIPILAIAATFRISDFWSSLLIISGRERETLAINVSVTLVALLIWTTTRFGATSADASIAYLAAFIAVGTHCMAFIVAFRHRRLIND